MKKLLLITVLLVVATTELMAQNKKAVEIKNLQNFLTKKEMNQFKIVANEESEINLKFNLKKEEAFNVLILDKRKNIVFSRGYSKEGENKIYFNMEEGELYTVNFISAERLKLVVTTFDKN